jgi:hypothetical protein
MVHGPADKPARMGKKTISNPSLIRPVVLEGLLSIVSEESKSIVSLQMQVEIEQAPTYII